LTSNAGVLTVLYTVYVTGKSAKNTHIPHITSILESAGTVAKFGSLAQMGMDVSGGFSMATACDKGQTLSTNSDFVWGVSSTLALRRDVDISTLSNMLLIPNPPNTNTCPSFIIKPIQNRAVNA